VFIGGAEPFPAAARGPFLPLDVARRRSAAHCGLHRVFPSVWKLHDAGAAHFPAASTPRPCAASLKSGITISAGLSVGPQRLPARALHGQWRGVLNDGRPCRRSWRSRVAGIETGGQCSPDAEYRPPATRPRGRENRAPGAANQSRQTPRTVLPPGGVRKASAKAAWSSRSRSRR